MLELSDRDFKVNIIKMLHKQLQTCLEQKKKITEKVKKETETLTPKLEDTKKIQIRILELKKNKK